jgi:RNA recognition motif-containing protein
MFVLIAGMEIAPNGIVMPYDHRTGKSTGESYVCFVDKATAEKAIQKHMHNIQHR